MTTCTVLHIVDSSDGSGAFLNLQMAAFRGSRDLLAKVKEYAMAGNYQEVASMFPSNRDAAFRATQNIDGQWCPLAPIRSTSVGDVVKENNTFYVCATFGWLEVTDPDAIAAFQKVTKAHPSQAKRLP